MTPHEGFRRRVLPFPRRHAHPVRVYLEYRCGCSAGVVPFPTQAQAASEQERLRGRNCPYADCPRLARPRKEAS